jgi:hypothetical protein
MMSKPVDELLQSILDDFAAGKQTHEAIEAKALFRLLNYCPPPALEMGETESGRQQQRRSDP